MTKLFIFSGWPWTEHEVSIASAKNIVLSAKEVLAWEEVHLVLFEKDGNWKLDGVDITEEVLFSQILTENGVVFPCIHGAFWEDGELTFLLESLQVPFVGSWSIAGKRTIDKQQTGEFLASKNIRTPKSYVIRDISEIEAISLEFPCIVKPRDEWSSISLYKPKSREELICILEKELDSRSDILVQEYVKGREFTCGVVELKGGLRSLPPSEIILTKGEVFDYSAKYSVGWCQEVTPANIDAMLRSRIEELALQVHRYCECKDISRTDIILDDRGELVVLEINILPGMTQTSFVPAQLKAAGYSLQDFLSSMIQKYTL